MEVTEKTKKKAADGYETLRVRSEIKARILKVQNDHFTKTSKKISVTDLLREALDARSKQLAAAPKANRASR